MPHIHEKIDFTVEIFIVHMNKVLLRMHDKHKIWLSVGGHIELDEDPIEAAIREVKEEVGLDVIIASPVATEQREGWKDLTAPQYLNRHRINDGHEHVCFVYFATASTDVLTDATSDHEKTETRWVTKEDIEVMDLQPNVRFYALQALETLGK